MITSEDALFNESNATSSIQVAELFEPTRLRQLSEEKEGNPTSRQKSASEFSEAAICGLLMEDPPTLRAAPAYDLGPPSTVNQVSAPIRKVTKQVRSSSTVPSAIALRESKSLDLVGRFGFCGIMVFLLLFLGKDTYEVGIAWWHFALGGFVIGTSILLGGPLLQWLIGEEFELV